MQEVELANLLKRAVRNAPRRQIVVSIHLFGIRYAEALRWVSLPALVEAAGISPSYATEIRKGMNLSDFVVLR